MSKPVWIEIAEKELGVKEVPGPGNSPRVLEYHKATKLQATEDSVAWCSAFVNWVLMRAKCKRTHSASARSWLQSDAGTQLKAFKPNCVVVFKRGNSTWQGHVTFGLRIEGDHIVCLGGNQGDKVSIARYPVAKAIGFVWPEAI